MVETATLTILLETRPRRDVGTSRDRDGENESPSSTGNREGHGLFVTHNFNHFLKCENAEIVDLNVNFTIDFLCA